MRFRILAATVNGMEEHVTEHVKTDSVGEFHLDDVAYASKLGDLRGTTMIVIMPIKEGQEW